ncbi:C4-dicarboxylate ABC transporter permease [Desulfocarbo indianensis]|nr:C4-dicarboxylate ABC transporter permease [Desulfocarbo indianensis]
MDLLKSIAKRIDAINEWVGRGVSWVTTGLVVVVFVDVVMRYAFKTSFVFTQELEWHLFAFIFLMGAGYTLLHDGHVRVDIIFQRLSTRGQAWVNLIGCLVFLFPGCYLVIVTSYGFAAESFRLMEGSPDPGGIAYRYVLKACIPLGFSLFTLQGVSLFIRSLLTITGRGESREGEVAI